MRRHKIGHGHSKKMFSRNAGSHPKNMPRKMPMRGGIRL